MNYLKLIGGIVLGTGALAAAAAGAKYAFDELEAQRETTRRARKKADEDIAAAQAQTEEVRRQTEEAIAESDRKRKEADKNHKSAMERLKATARKEEEEAAIRSQAITDFENDKITIEALMKILAEHTTKPKPTGKKR